VLRRSRPAAALCAVLLVPALGACGGGDSGKADDKESQSASPSSSATSGTSELSQVSFSGDVGKSLTATWHDTVDLPDSTTVTTLVEGDGSEIADGDTVSTYLYVGDGTTKQDVYSDYDQGAPESIPNDAQLGEVFGKLLSGATYGSRVAAVTSATALLGSSAANNQLGVGANDSLVVVADLVEKAAVAPTPADDQAHDVSPGTQPSVVE
jgi:peptidylprolyl isomerase